MSTTETIENKVAKSPLITLDLADYYPAGPRLELDISPWLYEGIMLREKDFRAAVKQHDWAAYQDSYVAVHCSADAIVPQWAYMLLAAQLSPYAKKTVYGSLETLNALLMEEALQKLEPETLRDKPVIVKGCGDIAMPAHAYLAVAARLQPVVKSLMFGEACSTVPVYKRRSSSLPKG